MVAYPTDFSKSLSTFVSERLASKESSVRKRKEYLKNEIKVQVETLKQHLEQLEEEMLSSLDSSCANVESSLTKLEQSHQAELRERKALCEALKQNAFSYAYGAQADTDKKHKFNLEQQQHSVDKCLKNLNDLNQLNGQIGDLLGELRFDPNVDLPGKSIIGNF